MTDHQHDAVRSLFDKVVEAPADQRETVLDRECAGDDDLKQRILAMVEAAEDPRFLAEPTAHTDRTVTMNHASAGSRGLTPGSNEAAGERIDRYKLLEQIGEGGFGTVWAAEQKEPVKRRVALKIIKLGMDTKQVIARFEAERQALAMMDHPNIARVLDAGSTETGRPYFVMELVKGVPILEYCDHERLDIRARLGLFTQVCNAIQHAHQKGIVHRDIKPSNVLVTMHDGVPVPKVIDFGIAKATNAELTEKTIYTEHRQMIGTPAYMSPEQAEMSGLDIDTRSDIYSLGVLLYEMLTGTTPFTQDELMGAGFEGMMRMIRETEPQKPSTRVSTLGQTATRSAQQRRSDVHKLSHIVRGDLDWIVMKCLEKDRTRRYETANGLAADVNRHLHDEAVMAGPPSRSYKIRKFVKRHRRPVASVALVAVVLAIMIPTLAVLYIREQSAREDAAALANYFMTAFGKIGWALQSSQEAAGVSELSALELAKGARDLAGEELEGRPLLEAEVRLALQTAMFAFGDMRNQAEQWAIINALYREAGLDEDDPRVLFTEGMAIVEGPGGHVSLEEFSRALAIEHELRDKVGPCDEMASRLALHTIGGLWRMHRNEEVIAFHEEREGRCEPNNLTSYARTCHDLTRGMYSIALVREGRSEESLAILERMAVRPRHQISAFARGFALLCLGRVRVIRGAPGDGIAALTEGIALYERSIGKLNPMTIDWQTGLGVSLAMEGRFAEAEQAVRMGHNNARAIAGSQAVFAQVVGTDLVTIYLMQDKVDEAKQALKDIDDGAIAKQLLASETTQVSRLSYDLAVVQTAIQRMGGQYEEAERLATATLERLDASEEPWAKATDNRILLLRELGYIHAARGDNEAAAGYLAGALDRALIDPGPRSPLRRWIDLDLAKLDAGALDTDVYMQDGWVELARARDER